jgi:hypothetical protein
MKSSIKFLPDILNKVVFHGCFVEPDDPYDQNASLSDDYLN